MFDIAQQKLAGIDRVLREELAAQYLRWDVRAGFDPSRTYEVGELAQLTTKFSVQMMRLTGEESKYVLAQAQLRGQGKSWEEIFLCGFEGMNYGHTGVMGGFLNGVCGALEGIFPMQQRWPRDKAHILLEGNGLELVLTALGGGRWRFKEGVVVCYGSSDSFGCVGAAHKEVFVARMDALMQKELFKGCTYLLGAGGF